MVALSHNMWPEKGKVNLGPNTGVVDHVDEVKCLNALSDMLVPEEIREEVLNHWPETVKNAELVSTKGLLTGPASVPILLALIRRLHGPPSVDQIHSMFQWYENTMLDTGILHMMGLGYANVVVRPDGLDLDVVASDRFRNDYPDAVFRDFVYDYVASGFHLPARGG